MRFACLLDNVLMVFFVGLSSLTNGNQIFNTTLITIREMEDLVTLSFPVKGQ